MPCDPRWRPVPTFWLLGCQLMCVLIVLGISAYDIGYIRDVLVAKPAHRLVLNVICSTFSALAILLHAALFVKARLHPLFSIAVNTALWFFWLAVCFYQSIGIARLKSIFDVMCPKRFKDKWLYCQNPKFTLTFSIITTITYGVFILYACMVYRRTSRSPKGWYGISVPLIQRHLKNDESLEDLLPHVDEDGASSSARPRL